MPDTEMLELLKQRLQRKQYKLTMQRRTVLEILLEHPGEHLSAEDVYGALRDKSSDVASLIFLKHVPYERRVSCYTCSVCDHGARSIR